MLTVRSESGANPGWFRQVGPYRVLTNESHAQLVSEARDLDPFLLSGWWGAIIAQRGPWGWVWRTIDAQRPDVKEWTLAQISGSEPWALFHGPDDVVKMLDGASPAAPGSSGSTTTTTVPRQDDLSVPILVVGSLVAASLWYVMGRRTK